jgi:hypothetical protein
MSRALIAVGCDIYDQFDRLPLLDSAESDAARLYDVLLQDEIGGYDPGLSSLLLSPRGDACREALASALAVQGGLDVLTFYFAGHGVIDKGSFYLCMRDASVEQLWRTGLSLTHVFGMLAGAQPRHVNIIMDACFSGGVVSDLGLLMRPEVIGPAGSISITLLAMSALDRESLETPAGGIGTSALLRCIMGEAFVQNSSSSLELTEIAPVLCEHVAQQSSQEPAWYALNHTRKSPFCRNPHFQTDPADTFSQFSPRAFLRLMQPILASHSLVPREMMADVERLTSGLLERAQSTRDAFKLVEVRGTAAVALLEYASTSQQVRAYLSDMAARVSDDVKSLLLQICARLSGERLALAQSGCGVADLFYSPLRLTRILGWIGAAYHIDRGQGREASFPLGALEQLAECIITTYAGSFALMSDAQAPDLAIAFTAMHLAGLHQPAEALLGLLFHSVQGVRGNIADAHLSSDRVIHYLLAREGGNFEDISVLARPSEAVTVLLCLGGLFGLGETFDLDMDRIDGLPLNAYLADDFTLFARERIPRGRNVSFLIGEDLWRVSDLELNWPEETPAPRDSVTGAAVILAALLFRDRVPWHLLDECR